MQPQTITSASPHKLCLIPGPIEFHEDVLAAMATPGTSHVDPAFIGVFGETLEMLRTVALTKTGQPFVLSGSGTLGIADSSGWDLVVSNLMESGDSALIINTGYFGDRFGECYETFGFDVTHLCPQSHGDRPSLEQIRQALKSKFYKTVNITHVDTSTGVLQNVKEICEVVRSTSPESLIIVDGVCSFGAEELRMDEWGVDAFLTASQKALGTPSGLCVAVVSQKAIKSYESRKTPVANYYCSWRNWLPIMRAYEARKPSYFATPAVSLIIALHTSLKQLVAAGMDARFAKHREVSARVKDTLDKWGLKLVPVSRELAANTLTAVYYPGTLTAADLLPRMSKRNIILAGGLHPAMAAKYFRIGHMGISAVESERGHMDALIKALEESLAEAGHVVGNGNGSKI